MWILESTTGIPYFVSHDDEFGWDPKKAARNFRDHGVTFEQGVKALRDPFGVEWIDDRVNYGEERINALGMCEGMLGGPRS